MTDSPSSLPSRRAIRPALVMTARALAALAIRLADPRSGALLPDVGTLGASSFFYPLHYNLHLRA